MNPVRAAAIEELRRTVLAALGRHDAAVLRRRLAALQRAAEAAD